MKVQGKLVIHSLVLHWRLLVPKQALIFLDHEHSCVKGLPHCLPAGLPGMAGHGEYSVGTLLGSIMGLPTAIESIFLFN